VARPGATALDAFLHLERTGTIAEQQKVCSSIGGLPDGAFVTDDEQNAYLVLRHRLLRWDPAGYQYARRRAICRPARLLTPASVVRTLEAGYPVGIHASAPQAIVGRGH